MSVADSKTLYWDSCVIIRWLTETPSELVDQIDQFLEEAEQGKRIIVTSTISLAEVRPQFLKKKGYDDIFQFFGDFESALHLIDAGPNIMARAGMLKDLLFEKDGGKRVVGTGDAIHLMTCLHAKIDRKMSDIVFHTFDEGKKNGSDGKNVPLIGFETWAAAHRDNEVVKQVLGLSKCRPEHPSPKMFRR